MKTRMLRRFAPLLALLTLFGMPSGQAAAQPEQPRSGDVAALSPQAAPESGRIASTPPPVYGQAHPTVEGMNWWGDELGWGRWTTRFTDGTATNATFTWRTRWYASASSRGRIQEAVAKIGAPVVYRETSPSHVPSEATGAQIPGGSISVNCRYITADGTVGGRHNRPCEHRNQWRNGPRNAQSVCDLRSCETEGHQDQGGWSTFLAHQEVWRKVYANTTPGETVTVFLACTNCGPPACVPGTAGCPDPCTTGSPSCPDPKCIPGEPDCPKPKCVPGTPDCPNVPCPVGDPECPPICTDVSQGCAPPPPNFCRENPTNEQCRVVSLEGVRYEVILDVPDRFATKGTRLAQGARVHAIRLLCGDRPCDAGANNVDPAGIDVKGRLTLTSPNSGYRRCTSAQEAGCGYLPAKSDTTTRLSVGDTASAYFFTPTKTNETVTIRINDLRGEVEAFIMAPVYEWQKVDCPASATSISCLAYGFEYKWVNTGRTARQPVEVRGVPVEVLTRTGRTVPAAGLPRLVIGTVGS